MTQRICFVAAPLIARSGVYNSTIELVRAGRAAGHDWRAVIGVSARAAGTPSSDDGVNELVMEPNGLRGVVELARLVRRHPDTTEADVVIGLVPQTDMALATTGLPWIAYLRGLPWPDANEASRLRTLVWRSLERRALARALAVWATTPTLAGQVGDVVDRIVGPGLVPPTLDGLAGGDRFVWAARFSIDKHPDLFLEAAGADPTLQGVMYGVGPLEDQLTATAPPNVTLAGWAARAEIWQGARAYVGTSTREAFGRSAVEAAMMRLPVIVSDRFGCAPFLYTDDELRARFVLPVDAPERWTHAMQTLRDDDQLWRRVSAHVSENAGRLSIGAAVERVRAAADEALTTPAARRSPST